MEHIRLSNIDVCHSNASGTYTLPIGPSLSLASLVSLEQRLSAGGDSDVRMLLPKRHLMRDANCEDDAEAWHAVYAKQLCQPLVDDRREDGWGGA